MSGLVTLIGAGPGDPELITIRGFKALRRADVVLYDDLVDATLLDGLRAEQVYVGKRCGRHAMGQERIIALMARLACAGLRVARLKGGDPTVFGRGAEEAIALLEQGIAVEIVPGVSSAVGVPALAGIPVTHRGVADCFAVVTAHRRQDDADLAIPAFNPRMTVVLLMGVQTMTAWVEQMRARGYPEEVPVAFVVDGATARQRVVETTLAAACADAAAAQVASPAVVVVGNVVRLRGQLLGAEAPVAAEGPADAHADREVAGVWKH